MEGWAVRTLTSLVISLMSVILLSCKEEEVQSTWVRTSVNIDGNVEEWKESPFVVFQEEHLALSLSNDSTYLYLAGRTSDATLQRLIERLGVTLLVDPEGGSSEELEVHFPAGRISGLREGRGGFWESMTEEQRAKALRQIEEMRNGILVIDHRSVESHVYPARTAAGFAAGIAPSSGLLTFEVRIPIHIEKYFSGFSTLGTTGKVGIGIKLSRSRSPEAGEYSGRPGGFAGPRGGRGRGGGGMGRPPRGGEAGDNASDVWVGVLLANAK